MPLTSISSISEERKHDHSGNGDGSSSGDDSKQGGGEGSQGGVGIGSGPKSTVSMQQYSTHGKAPSK